MIFNKSLVMKIFVIVFLVAILAALILWFFGSNLNLGVEKENPTINVRLNDGGGFPGISGGSEDLNNNSENTVAITKNEISRLDIENTAIFVAERFGSYSTDTDNFKNLRDVQSLMTDKMRSEIDSIISNYNKKDSSNNYYGVTTKALGVEILNQSYLDDGIAKVLVSTQRVETINKENPIIKTKYQELEMVVKKNGKWLVDSAIWK